jgi:hypothetical protein
MDHLQKRIETLSPEKRALLEQMRKQRLAKAASADAIPRRFGGSTAPLSLAQQRLWFLEQLVPGSAVYIMPSAVRLSGALDVAALAWSLNIIVARHAVLRTSFKAVQGEPVQEVAPELALELPLDDLSQLPQEAQAAAVEELIRQEARKPFDLATAPLMRVRLLRLHPEGTEHILCLMLHHIIADGWSLGVIIRELANYYAAFANGQAAKLHPEGSRLPIQYADYAIWQREWLQGAELERQRAYWREQLQPQGRPLPTLALPTDRPRPPVQSYQGAQEVFALPAELTEQLKSVSQAAGATLFMTLMAGFKALLHCYTGQHEIVVGTDVAGRSRAETIDLIGFFVNQLVLRSDLSGDPSFEELLRRVRDVALAAYAHQDLPFDQLVELLNIPRDLSRTPLFQVKLVLQNAPLPALELPGLSLRRMDIDPGTAKFDLLLNIWEEQGTLVGTLDYNTDIFNQARIVRLLETYQQLLAIVVKQPGIALAALAEQMMQIDREYQQRRIEARKAANLERLRGGRRRAATSTTE